MDQGGGSHADTPDLIIGDPDASVKTTSATTNECLFHAFLS